MMRFSLLLASLLHILFVSLTHVAWSLEIIDLSYDYETGVTHQWPTATPFQLIVVADGIPDGKDYYYSSNDICTTEHAGTHLDSPIHFYKDKWSVEQIPLDRLINIPAAVIHLSNVEADYNLQVSDLERYEEEYGRIPNNALLLIDFGWAARWSNKTLYLGTPGDDVSKLLFPSLGVDSVRWLVDNGRDVFGVGLDTASVDPPTSTTFDNHVLLASRNTYNLENLNNLALLPASGSTVSVLPMKIKGGSGAPARVFAMVDEGSGSSSSSTLCPHLIIISLLIILL